LNRRQFIQSLGGIVTATSLFPPLSFSSGKPPLTLGVFPRRNVKITFRMFLPMAKYLEQVLGREVRLKTERTFADFWQAVQKGEYDIVHYNQYHYIISRLKYGYEVFAKNKELGNSTIAGSLIVRKDSGYNEVRDLKGKEVLFGGDKSAMQSYIAATWLLRQSGLKAGDYIEKFAINPPNTIISTYFKRADASGSGDVVMHLDNVKNRIDISQLKFLAKTVPMAHLPWAVRSDLPEDLKKNIIQTLLDLSTSAQGKSVLAAARLDALEPATDAEYELHKKIIVDVYGESMGEAIL